MEKKEKPTGLATTTSITTRTTRSPYNDVAEFKDGLFHFSFQASLKWMERQGKILFGDHFRIYPQDHSVIYKLLVYAIGDQKNCRSLELKPDRGLLALGPIGCGKTSLLTLTSYFCPPEKQYPMKPARELSFEFEKEGFTVINRYSKGSFFPGRNSPVPLVYCFDDLGIEQPVKYFGNQYNVMAEVLLSCYDLFISKRMLTHATTNLSASELEERYGNRIRSRMREMFNLVTFDKDTKDKQSPLPGQLSCSIRLFKCVRFQSFFSVFLPVPRHPRSPLLRSRVHPTAREPLSFHFVHCQRQTPFHPPPAFLS